MLHPEGCCLFPNSIFVIPSDLNLSKYIRESNLKISFAITQLTIIFFNSKRIDSIEVESKQKC